MVRRAGAVRVVRLTGDLVGDAGALIANEHRVSALDATAEYGEPAVCADALSQLLASGFDGWCALDGGDVAGVMCVRTVGAGSLVPAHGVAVRVGDDDPTSLVMAMLEEVTAHARRAGARRITLDHPDTPGASEVFHRAGFGGGGVFAVRATAPFEIEPGAVSIRRGAEGDLRSIGELSHVEFMRRFAAPVHALQPVRTEAGTIDAHREIMSSGGVHFLATIDGRDVGLLTLEAASPAPRLCPDGAFIGPTATLPDVRQEGVATALLAAAVEEARRRGLDHVGVDFAGNDPVSRPFWLRRGFVPTGFRLRRVLVLE